MKLRPKPPATCTFLGCTRPPTKRIVTSSNYFRPLYACDDHAPGLASAQQWGLSGYSSGGATIDTHEIA